MTDKLQGNVTKWKIMIYTMLNLIKQMSHFNKVFISYVILLQILYILEKISPFFEVRVFKWTFKSAEHLAVKENETSPVLVW